MPRLDRPDSSIDYCRLMLIFFKPWVSALDLKRDDQTWLLAYDEFINSNDIYYSHLSIMENIQFLHACRDSRD
ncbi:hypothetical protein F5887DRAFT_1148779, partial [Amanita rubescens]